MINHSFDTRYSEGTISTHDKNTKIKCHMLKNLETITPEYIKTQNVNAIFINEGQFFTDLSSTVIQLVDIHKKTVHVNGLDGDYKRDKFGQLLDLIPYCDDVIKLKALCGVCKNCTKGIFTYRKTQQKEQIIVSQEGMYVPVCRNCYNTLEKMK